jgi:hypothetical protein
MEPRDQSLRFHILVNLRTCLRATSYNNNSIIISINRPDGLTLIPWQEGRSASWDVTVANTVATYYLSFLSLSAASAAANAAHARHKLLAT